MITVASDILVGFIPSAISYVGKLFNMEIVIIFGPIVGASFNIERIVMIACYVYVFRKKSGVVNTSTGINTNSNERTTTVQRTI